MTVRVGVIGTGLMGGIHARATQDAEGATLVAVGGGTRAGALGARLGVAVEPSAEALLDRTDLDAVVITSLADPAANVTAGVAPDPNAGNTPWQPEYVSPQTRYERWPTGADSWTVTLPPFSFSVLEVYGASA